MCQTGHNFYAIRAKGIKDWDYTHGDVPENYHLLPMSTDSLVVPPWLTFDMVLSQDKVGQFQMGAEIARQLQLPHINIEHTLPMPDWDVGRKAQWTTSHGDTNVFVSEYQREAWGFPDDFGFVNHTGIDLDAFRPPEDPDWKRENWALSVVHDWINRDWCCGFTFWREVTGFPSPAPMIPYRILGDTPGLSRPAPNMETLIQFYHKAGVYLNTTLVSSLPTVILEAMACGCPVVSTDTCMIPNIIIEHGKNGLVGKTPEELRRYAHEVLNNPVLAKRLGEAGRKTVEEKFSQKRFVDTWTKIFKHTAEVRK
jgi:glycosyltransferase involved in cell wall biosynthesis